jgi:hypothetical protein
MTKKNIQCSLAGLGSTTALRAQGRCGFDGVEGSGCCWLGEDDCTTDLGTAWVVGVVGSRMAWGAQRRGLGEEDVVVGLGTASRVRG